MIGEHILHEHPAAMMLVDSGLAGRRYFLRRGQGWVFFRRGQRASRTPCGALRGLWGPGQSKRWLATAVALLRSCAAYATLISKAVACTYMLLPLCLGVLIHTLLSQARSAARALQPGF